MKHNWQDVKNLPIGQYAIGIDGEGEMKRIVRLTETEVWDIETAETVKDLQKWRVLGEEDYDLFRKHSFVH